MSKKSAELKPVHIEKGDIRFPIVLRGLCVILSLVVGLSAVAGIVHGVRSGEELLIGFELCVLVASVFGVLTGFGKFGSAPALSMFIVGGVILVGAVLGDRSFASVLEGAGMRKESGSVNLLPFIMARLGASGLYVALAGLTVLSQRPKRSAPLLVKGLILATPIAGVVAVIAVPSIRNAVFGLNGIVQAAVALAAMLVVIGFISASGHYVIRAFEAGLPEHGGDGASG